MILTYYTKLFSSLVASTIWREDDKTRIVWITLLALSDRDGYVAGSVPGLADLARVSVEDCEKAIQKLQQPDKYSRSQEYDGRRIQVVDGGWLVLNRTKYRDFVPDEHRREVDRIRQQRHRRAKRQTRVTRDSHDCHSSSRQKEKEKETKKKPLKPTPGAGAPFVRPTLDEVKQYCLERGNQVDAGSFVDHYEANGWRVGRCPMRDWRAAVRNWERSKFDGKPNGRTNNAYHDDGDRTKYSKDADFVYDGN